MDAEVEVRGEHQAAPYWLDDGSTMSSVDESADTKAVIAALGPDELGVLDALGEQGALDDTSLATEAGLSVSSAQDAVANLKGLRLVREHSELEGHFELDEARLDTVLDNVNETSKKEIEDLSPDGVDEND